MKYSFTFTYLSAAFILSYASPIPDVPGPVGLLGCGLHKATESITVSSKQINVPGIPVTAASTCTPVDNEECQLSKSSSYTVSKAVTVGVTPFGQAGTSSVIGSSIGVTVSWSTAKGSVDGSGSNCPLAPKGADQWTCSLKVTPQVCIVSGTQTTNTVTKQEFCDVTPNQPYTLELPILNSDGDPNINTQLCACGNHPGWASPGVPPKCPTDC